MGINTLRFRDMYSHPKTSTHILKLERRREKNRGNWIDNTPYYLGQSPQRRKGKMSTAVREPGPEAEPSGAEVWTDVRGEQIKFDGPPFTIQGKYIGFDYAENLPFGPANIYYIQTSQGVKNFIAPTILDGLMQKIQPGDMVQIHFQGKTQSKKDPTRTISNFAVKVRASK